MKIEPFSAFNLFGIIGIPIAILLGFVRLIIFVFCQSVGVKPKPNPAHKWYYNQNRN